MQEKNVDAGSKEWEEQQYIYIHTPMANTLQKPCLQGSCF